jgi:hypothetical protein
MLSTNTLHNNLDEDVLLLGYYVSCGVAVIARRNRTTSPRSGRRPERGEQTIRADVDSPPSTAAPNS